MMRWLKRCLAAVILGATLSSPVCAQPSTTTTPETERRPPAPEFAVAFLSAILILVIICMPSRKQ